jgi:hypothetical protein
MREAVEVCFAACDGDQGTGATDASGAMDEDRGGRSIGLDGARGSFRGADEVEDGLGGEGGASIGPIDALVVGERGVRKYLSRRARIATGYMLQQERVLPIEAARHRASPGARVNGPRVAAF